METPATIFCQKVQENNSNSKGCINPKAVAAVRRASQKTGRIVVVEMRASYGPDIRSKDDRGLTPLRLAVKDDDTIQGLIDAGVYVNAKNVQGDTSLHLAVSEGSLGIVQKLLKDGANTGTKNYDGLMPVDLVKSGCTNDEIAKLLINDQDTRCREFLEVETKHLLGSDADTPEI